MTPFHATDEPARERRLMPHRLAAACVVLLMAFASVATAQKTDVIRLSNGDRITGEIKELTRGKLRYKTDSIGTLSIEWEEILRVTSFATFEIETENGQRYFGTLVEPSQDGRVAISAGTSVVELDIPDIVSMAPIAQRFWKRLDGSISFGLSYTKASQVGQFSTALSADYRVRKYRVGLNANSTVTSQAEETDKTRHDLRLEYTRFRKNRYFGQGALSFQHNDELGLDLRTSTTGTYGRNLVHSNSSLFSLSGGLSVNRERTADMSDPTRNNVEAVLELGYSLFRFDDPETDISVSLSVYPSLTESGRVRGDMNVHARRELIKDFYIELSGYVDYDNQSGSADATSTDWSVTSSLGWTF